MTQEANQHQECEIQLEDFLDSTPVAVAWSNISTGRIEYINKAFEQFFGYTLEEISDIEIWYQRVCPDPEYRQTVIEPWIIDFQKNAPSQKNLKTRILCKDGFSRQVSICFSTVGDIRLWHFTDITDYWVAEKRLRARSEMLEMVSKSSALKDILNVIVKQVQLESLSSVCSVSLFDSETQRLMLGAAPDLPNFYNQAIEGIEIGMNVGSCGTAAYLNERVIVEDIRTHPYWQDYAQLAKDAGVVACWSDPIRSAKGELLGAFAMYHATPKLPTEKDLELINFASSLASIAIENHNSHQELERRAYCDSLTGLANRRSFFELAEKALLQCLMSQKHCSMLMMDVDHFKSINDAYGHASGDLVLKQLAKMLEQALPDDAILGRIGGEEFAILLPDRDGDMATRVAECIRETLANSAVKSLDNQSLHFTVSLGVSFKVGVHCNIDELLRLADKALYQAKETGRNRVCVANCFQSSFS
ncbi:bifunctional diguanylate cyclase/phosphodiesterase [Marinomonas transparens]|uniref:diguanylate cyclase n=1 Tax=Marinomonas transparens TaxID=2795388 RepID=A0A934MUQ3_9GAMM|nr:diguanylate cyclase [Marinomonas transparens]MBJ7536199.1 diguanylate cyclase [Marinomonas transparens]